MHFIPINLFVFVFCVSLFHNSVVAFSTNTNSSEESFTDSFASGLKVVYRAYEQCEAVKFGELLTCLKLKALKLADRVLRSDSVQVIDGINIVKTFSKDADRKGRKLNFEPLPEVNDAVLPIDPQQKQDKLNEMLIERMARFFQTHSVQFDTPGLMKESKQLLGDYTVEEGRAKKKGANLLMLGGMFKGGMLALGLNALALLAGKALLVAKIALVVSAVAGLSSLLSSGHGEEKTTYEIVKHPHVSHDHTQSNSYFDGGHDHFDFGDHGHFKRSVQFADAAKYPHLLAYRRHLQSQKS